MSAHTLARAFTLVTATLATVLGAPAVPDCPKLGTRWAVPCEAVAVLQRWYDPLEGNWEDTEFWGSASALHALVDFEQASGDSALLPVIRRVHAVKSTTVVRLLGRGSYDDLQWWVLAYGHAHQLTGEQGFLQTAEDVFETVWMQAWDTTTCGGGLWWDDTKHYKNAITNELGIANAALLYQATKNPKYLARAREQWAWFEGSGMINGEGLVNDGLNSGAGATCSNNNSTEWTYNQGVVLEGLVRLANATGNTTLVDVAARIAAAAIAKLCNADGVLVEAGLITDRDQAQFKGIFARGVRLLLDCPTLVPNLRSLFGQFLATNAVSVIASDRTAAGGRYGGLWQGPVDVHAIPCSHQSHECGNTTGATPQTSALELLVAAAR